MARVGALAAALALASIVPLAQGAHAGDIATADAEALTGSPVGVLVMGGGPDETPPVVEDPAPPTKTPDDSPSPSNDPPPAGNPTSGAIAAAPGASGLRPPRRADVLVSSPASVASPNAGPAASAVKATPSGEGLSLEDIFLNSRASYAGRTAAPSHAARSGILMPNSSVPSMLMTTLLAMLGALLVASRYYGSSFFAWPLGAALQRRSAPRGWRVVATTPLPPPAVRTTSISDLERPVLAAVQSPATSSR